ncbi:MAG: DUF4428 domain-containing protein [Christensenellales bacterium]|jgi:hypothetical protein
MGLFDKKYCDVCSERIGLLGNRKLEDGNLCKDCAKKLSPFFNERRRSTVSDIKEQLEYREENKASVSKFNITRTLGMGTKVLLDEDAGKFIVTSARRWQEENPDVLDFSQVTGCNVDIDEDRTELKREGNDGKQIAYNPPRYIYSYNFTMTIHVNSPWFDEIRFRLNSSTIEIESPAGRVWMQGGADVGRRSVEYRECEALAEEIKEALMQVRQSARESIAAANTPKSVQICPLCGATTTPDASGRCEYCGGAMQG